MNLCMDKQYLEKKYLEEGLSTVSIAHIEEVHPSTVLRWLRRFKIPVRPPKRKGERLRDPKKIREVQELLAETVKDDDLMEMLEDDVEELMWRAEHDERRG